MSRWAIVGGGVLGISLALDLREQGHDVTLIEAGPSIGGLADAWTVGPVTWDRHYHVVLESDANTRAFIERLGLGDDLHFHETRTGCFADGELHSVSTPMELLRLPTLAMIDKLRLAATVAYASRLTDWRRLEQIPVADWLIPLSGRRAYERFWLPLLRSKLGDNVEHASAAFLWAIIQRLMRARRNGLGSDRFGHVDGGYDRVLREAAAQLDGVGVIVSTSTPVRTIRSNADRTITVDLASSNPTSGRPLDSADSTFDAVVVTTAAPVAADLIDALTPAEQQRLYGVRYQGIVCASALMTRPLSEFYVTNLIDSDLPFTGVIEMTALLPTDQFEGRHLVYLPRYTTADDPANEWSDVEVRRRFVDGLQRMHPDLEPDDIEAFEISRVRHVVPISELSYSERVPGMTTSIENVFIVNGSQIVNGTLNVDETLALAERALPVISGAVRRPTSGATAA